MPHVCGIDYDVGLICPLNLLANNGINLRLTDPESLCLPRSTTDIALVGVFEEEAAELRMGDRLAALSIGRQFEQEFIQRKEWPEAYNFVVFVRNRGEEESLQLILALTRFIRSRMKSPCELPGHVAVYDPQYFVEWLRYTRQVVARSQVVFVTNNENALALKTLERVKKLGANIRLLREGERALPHEIVLLDGANETWFQLGWEGSIRIAAHQILQEKGNILPSFVTGPFVVELRLINDNESIPIRELRSMIKRYERFFEDPVGQITPYGTPQKVSRPGLVNWLEEVDRVLNPPDEAVPTTLW